MQLFLPKVIKASFKHGFVEISTVRRFAPADSTPVPVPVQLTKLLARALALAQVRVRVNFAPAPAQAHVAGGCRRSCHRLHRPRRLFVSHSRSSNDGQSSPSLESYTVVCEFVKFQIIFLLKNFEIETEFLL